MSDNWVVQNLQNALTTWNEKLAEIWTLVTQSPQAFKGGSIWGVMVGIHGAVKAIGLALIVLFFVMGVMKTCGTFADLKRPEVAVKAFVRFALAKAAVTNGLELMNALFSIAQGLVSTIMSAAGFGSPQQAVLPSEIITAVEDCGFFESIPLWAVTLIGGLLITVLSFVMIMTVYGRFFKLYLYTAIAPVPMAAFAGEPTQSIGISFITKLTDQSRSMMLSIDIIPVATDEAVREVERKMLGVETNITNWQRRQNANNNFSAIVPYDMEQQRRETKEYMTDLTSRDQRMLLSVLTIVHLADSKAELDADTDALLKVAADHMCQMAVLRYQQMDGLNTALPIGTRKIDTFRTLTTESLAVFMPFKVQEIQEPGGIYFGENAISHNLILCNMNNLLNQSMMLLGIPGSGKSFFAKLLIIAIALSTDDDIIILDPEGEYTPLVNALGGAVMRFAVGGSDWLNAMAMEEGYGEGSPVAFKSQFIMSLLKQIDPDGIRAHHKSIIDRCVALTLQEQKRTGKVATLCTLREKLLEQPEPEARDLALTMELYTSGSLNIFAHETNVDTKNRIQSYDIHDLGEELKQPGFVTITDAMINRVNYNSARGKKTHIIVDEFHIAYENEYSGNFFTSAWRQFRKRNASPVAITQNVEYMLDSVQASTMVSNSEFVVMLNQAESDQERLSKLLNISPEQMSYVNGSDAGCGLMRYGNALVPFVNRFPSDTELYKLITTKPGEGAFAKGQVDDYA